MSSTEKKDVTDATEAATEEATKAAESSGVTKADEADDAVNADEVKDTEIPAVTTSDTLNSAASGATQADAPPDSKKRKLRCMDCEILGDLLMDIYEESVRYDYIARCDVHAIDKHCDFPDKHDVRNYMENTRRLHTRIERACRQAQYLDPSLEMVDYVDEEDDGCWAGNCKGWTP